MQFNFATAGRIIFGDGSIKEISSQHSIIGDRPLLVTGKSTQRAEPLVDILNTSIKKVRMFVVPHEPTIDIIARGTEEARSAECTSVIGIGGGSVIDATKAIAALMTNKGNPIEYLEVIGEGKPLVNLPIPCIVLPTTAGTGTEVTCNAVIKSDEHNVKVSLRSDTMMPQLAIVDPLLTHSMPPEITASTGMDAITQLIEAFVSKKSNPITDSFCCKGLEKASPSIQLAYNDGLNSSARNNMCLASLLSGIVLANAKLGAVHGFAGPIGGMFNVPHGVICARLLPYVIEANVSSLIKMDKKHPILHKYNILASYITGKSIKDIRNAVEYLKKLCNKLNINSLSHFGINSDMYEKIADKALKTSSIKGNPVDLTKQDLITILENSES